MLNAVGISASVLPSYLARPVLLADSDGTVDVNFTHCTGVTFDNCEFEGAGDEPCLRVEGKCPNSGDTRIAGTPYLTLDIASGLGG